MNFPWDTANGYIVSLTSKLAVESHSNSTPSIITRLLESKHPIFAKAEPYFKALGKQVKSSSYQVATGWTRMALGDGTAERVFAIALGYAVIGLLIAFYLNVFTVGSVKSAGRAVRSAVRQQLLVVKVRLPRTTRCYLADICLGCNVHHHRTSFIPTGVRYQPRLMFHLAFPRSEPSIANCVLSVCTPDGNILSLGCGHNVYVSHTLWHEFCP
jgi:hypothetical protein